MSSAAVRALYEEMGARADAVHSMMILRHGHVIAEGWWAPYAADIPHELWSLSKSFTSSAVGLAQAEGLLSIDDRIVDIFPERVPDNASENLRNMRIRDLLRMSTGHHADVIEDFPFGADEDLVARFMRLPVAHKPGTHFVYNTPASFMLAAIVEKVSGEKLVDFLMPRLFEPLGIERPFWGETARGTALGGFGLYLKTEDIARFGQMLLEGGEFAGRRVLPRDWVAMATSRQTANGSHPDSDWDQGYGFQFWMCRHGGFRGDGAFGQFCIVLPGQDTVVAITSGTGDMGRVMNILWDRLLPELRAAPLPENEAEHTALRKTLAALSLPAASGEAQPGVKWWRPGQWIRFAENPLGIEAMTLEPIEGGTALVVDVHGESVRYPCGNGVWLKGGRLPTMLRPSPCANSGGWVASDRFEARLCLYETAQMARVTLRFAPEGVRFESVMNVGFGPQRPLVLEGRYGGR